MRTQIILILFLFSTVVISFGQKPKFKKVTKEELEKTVCEYDSTANAEYLYHGCKVKYTYNDDGGGFEVTYFYHDRIKIYNEDGIGFANQIIRYYDVSKNSNKEQVANLSAYTFNLEKGKVKSDKLDKDNIFEEKVNNYYSAKKFAMPAVKAGSVLEIRYELRSPHIIGLDEFYFQKDAPVKYAEYEISTPEYLKYTYNVKGLVELDLEEKQKIDVLRYSYVKNERNIMPGKVYENINYKSDVKIYKGQNVKRIIEEPFTYSMDNFKGSIKAELIYTQYPRANRQYFANSWNDIAERLNRSENFGDQLKEYYEEMAPLLLEVSSMEENVKIATIYSTIQKQFTWNNYSGIRTDKGIKNLIKEGTGNSAEINLLLVNVLQKSGLSAYPMVYKKRTSGYLNIANPTLAELDYVVAVVVKDDGVLYLDATDKDLTMGMLPYRGLNLKGVVMMGETGKEIPIKNHNKGSESKVYALEYDGENLIGTYKQSTKGYEAYNDRVSYRTLEDYTKNLQKEDVIFTNTKIKGFENTNKAISISSAIKIKGNAQKIEDKIFIDLMIGQEEFKSMFVSEKREYALFFNSKASNTTLIKVKIPEGYKVEFVPETLNIATPERYIKYLVKTQIIAEEIVITIRSSINETIISPAYYESIKLLYDQVAAISKEKIVLSKI